MSGPAKEALDPKIQASAPSMRIWEFERRGVPLKEGLGTLKGRFAPSNESVDPKNRALCPKNVCLVLKSVAVSKKNLALDPEAGVRALTKSTWSLQRCPLVLKREGLGNQKTTLDTKSLF